MLSLRQRTGDVRPAGRDTSLWLCPPTATDTYCLPLNVWVCGLYELAGQSIISNGWTTYCVVSYGSKTQPILNGLPSGAVACANGMYAFVCVTLPSVQGRLSLSTLLKRTLSPCGIGCV